MKDARLLAKGKVLWGAVTEQDLEKARAAFKPLSPLEVDRARQAYFGGRKGQVRPASATRMPRRTDSVPM